MDYLSLLLTKHSPYNLSPSSKKYLSDSTVFIPSILTKRNKSNHLNQHIICPKNYTLAEDNKEIFNFVLNDVTSSEKYKIF